MAEECRKKENLNVIILAKDTNNLVIFKFYSDNEKLKYIIICKEDLIFNQIGNQIYEMHPTYNKKGNYFVCNNSIVKEYMTLKENNIKNGNVITLIEHSGNTVNGVFIKRPKTKYEIEEENKIEELTKKLKEETNLDVIVLTKDTKDIITLRFKSGDQKINCSVICKNTDIFNSVANKIFEKNQVFKEYGNIFLCNDIQVNEYKSIKENNLRDGNMIIIDKMREDIDDNNNDPEREKRKLKKLAERIKKRTNINAFSFA